jgi:4-hydroxybenzoate polyprenyltransferase
MTPPTGPAFRLTIDGTRKSAMHPTLPRILLGYLRLPHAVPILTVMAATFAFSLLAVDGLPPTSQLLNVLGAMLGGQVAIGTVNELVDATTDARVKPEKPIPAGLVTRRGAAILGVVAGAAMVWFSSRLGLTSFLLCLAGTALGVAYSLWFKRSRLAWLPYLLALPLLPIWVFASLDRFDWQLLMLYPLGVFATLAVHLAQSLPDVEADRVSGIRNLTSTLGERRALVLCLGSMMVSLLLAAVAADVWTGSPAIVLGASAVVLGLLLLDAILYVTHPQTGVRACFPCVAASTVILGLAWVLALQR